MKLSASVASVFVPLPAELRESVDELYLRYLKAREGRLDFEQRKLSKREPFFQRLHTDPVRARRPINQECFHRNHEAAKPEPGLSPQLLWLLAIAKANRTEYFGMEEHIVVNGILDGDDADTQSYVDMQEVYHTRILLDVLRCFALEIEVGRPNLATRVAVHTMVRLPKRMAMPLILCAELLATVVFRLLLDEGRVLFADDEPLWERVSTLLEQIMVDEMGHVCYCRARLGSAGLAVARRLLPSVAAALLSDQPEFAQLIGAREFERALAHFDFDAAVQDCVEAPFWLDAPAVPIPDAR